MLSHRIVASTAHSLNLLCLGALAIGPASLLAQSDLTLPHGYSARTVYHSRLSGLSRIAISELGDIYVGQGLNEGGYRVSLLDEDLGEIFMVIEVTEGTSSVIFGGPGHSVFVPIGGELLQVDPTSPHQVWGLIAPGTAPWYWAPDGRILAAALDSGGNGEIHELSPDGSSTLVAGGFDQIYDVVGDDSGRTYVADLDAATIFKIDALGNVTSLTTTPPDNTDLAFDSSGELYLAAAGIFARVDTTTGDQTPISGSEADCPGIQAPADFVITPAARVYFASWVTAKITWHDLISGDGEGAFIVDDLFANTHAVDLGLDGLLYVAVNGCGASAPTRIVRYDSAGNSQVVESSLSGSVADIAFAPSGELYAALTTSTSAGLYLLSGGATLVPGSDAFEYSSLAVDQTTGNIYGAVAGSPTTSTMTIAEFDEAGLVATHVVSTPKPPQAVRLEEAPDGTLYAEASEAARFLTGPEVDRWILELDLGSDMSTPVAQINRVGCCPLNSFSVDSNGTLWWLLNPDSELYAVNADSTTHLFAENTPVDAGSAHNLPEAGIFMTTPEGILFIEKAFFADGFESGNTSEWSLSM